MTNAKNYILLLLILAIGFVYRSNRMSEESIWWDEFSSVIHLRPPSEYESSPHFTRWAQGVHYEPSWNILHFLIKNRSLDPATMPLYYSIEYLWHTYVDESFESLRFLSLMIGILATLCIYHLGSYAISPSAGLISSLFLTLSPIHRQFSIEIRMYGLFTLLAILSMLLFVVWCKQPKKHVFLGYLIINFLLLWTHPFAILVIMVQGLFFFIDQLITTFSTKSIKTEEGQFKFTLLFSEWKNFCIWCISVFLIAIPSTLYITTIQFWSPELTSSWMKIPTLSEFVGDLFADDCIGWTYQVRAEPNFWNNFFSVGTAKAIVSQQYFIGGIVVLLFILCFSLTIKAYLRKILFPMLKSAKHLELFATERFLVLWVIWWLFPPIFLYVISLIWRPCIMPRYTLHSSVGLYLILGYVLQRDYRKHSVFRRLIFYSLIFGYLYQSTLVIGTLQHTDWKKAGTYIKHHATANDIILVNNELWKRVFLFNLGPVPNIVAYGSHFNNTVEVANFILRKLLPERKMNARLWIVVQGDYFESAPLFHFEKLLKEKNILYKWEEFPGIQRVVVYSDLIPLESPESPPRIEQYLLEDLSALALELWRIKDYHSAVVTCKYVIQLDPSYAQAYSYLGMSYKELQEWDLALDAFRTSVELQPGAYPWNWVNIGDILIIQGKYKEAIEALNVAIQLLPNDSFAHTCLGRAYIGLNEIEKAKSYLQKAIELDPTDFRPIQELEKLKN